MAKPGPRPKRSKANARLDKDKMAEHKRLEKLFEWYEKEKKK